MPVSLSYGLLEHRYRLAYDPQAVHDAMEDFEAHALSLLLVLQEQLPGGFSNPLVDLDLAELSVPVVLLFVFFFSEIFIRYDTY